MADTTKDTLRNIMEKLSLADYKKFKHRLSDISQVPWSRLERMDCDETLGLIEETYTEERLSQVVSEILKHINLDQMAKDLEKKLSRENSGLESQSTGGSRNNSSNTDSTHPLISDCPSLLPDLRILLLGYKGSGKSSSGNSILGQQEFDTSMRTSTCVKRQGQVAGRKLTLVEAPSWWRNKTLDSILEFDKRELILSPSFCAPGPHAVLLVIDINQSFIELHRQSIQGHLNLFGDRIWKHIIILFTYGDRLGSSTIEQHIESEGKPLQSLVEKCGRRFHVLNNKKQQNDSQVKALLKKIELMVAGSRGASFEFDRRVLRELEEKKEEDDRRARGRMLRVQAQSENLRPPEGSFLNISDLRIVLLGYRIGGKSTVGNLILGRQEFIPAKRTACCVKREGNVAGRKVTLVEAPGWWKGYSINDTPERDKREIVLSMSLCPPGPHALLLVIDVTDPFVEEQKNAAQHHLELLGETVWSHTMVVFTHGDWLGHTPIEQYIDSDKQSLQWLVEKCGNRYHVLSKYSKEKVQVPELLRKIEELVAGNSGQHFDFDNKTLQELEEKKKEDERRASERSMRVEKQRERLKSIAGGLPSVPDLGIVLLGYRGAGKGSSGNTILGRQEFITSQRTFLCVKKEGRTARRKVTLVEAVGWVVWNSVENTSARDQQELIRSVSLCPPGPHALLLVLSVSLAFREDHRAAVQEHLELLGDDVWGHTMVLFTRGDWLGDTTIEEHIESGGEALKWVVEKCGNRYHILNNLNRQNRAQVSELLQKVQEMVAGNNNIPFTLEQSTEWIRSKLKELHGADTRAVGVKEPEHNEEASLRTEDDHSKHKTDQLHRALQNNVDFVDTSKITVCTDSLIGIGGFGKVYKGHYQGTPAAIKIIEIAEGLMTECFVPMFLSHPNIVRMMAFTKKDNQILIANEYINGANLHQVLYSQTTIKLDIKEKLQVALCVAMAVEYIHEKNIIHQDLKPANILIAKDTRTAFLTDWGLAKLRESMMVSRESRGSGGRMYGPSGGTVTYMSPECLVDCEDCSTMSDMWALGITLLEMLTGASPWTFSSVQELRRLLRKQQPPQGLDKLQPSHQALVKALLNYDLKSRMNATNLVASLKLLVD